MSGAKTAAIIIASSTRPKIQRGSRRMATSARQNRLASRLTTECGAAGARSSGLMSVVSATYSALRGSSSGAPPGVCDSTLRAIADPRIYDRVGEVDEQVDQNIGKR